MAITLSNFQKLVAGSKRRHIVTASIASYVTTGETVASASFGLQVVDGVIPLYGGGGRDVEYTGGKLVVYDSGGTEFTSGSTCTLILEVMGR